MLAPSGFQPEFIKLNASNSKIKIYGPKNDYIIQIGSDGDVEIKADSAELIKYNNIPMDYSANIKIHCSGNKGESYFGRLSIRRGDAVAKTLLNDSQNAEEIRKWIPFQLYHDNSEHFYIKDKNYGWWPQ